MKRKLRVGQIGIGHNHAEAKMNTVKMLPDEFEIIGVVEDDAEWREKRMGLPGYEDVPFMTEDKLFAQNPDIIFVETDVWNLVRTAQKCVSRGISIHMDKPAGEDMAEYEKMLDTADATGATVQLGYMYRYNDGIKYIEEQIRNGKIGKIYNIDAQMSTDHDDTYRKWLGHFKGGSMFIFGSHLIDLAVMLMGEPNEVVPLSVSSGKSGINTSDNGLAVLRYDGANVTIRTSSVEVNGWGRRQFVVCGEKGTIELKPLEIQLSGRESYKEEGLDAYIDTFKEIALDEKERKFRYYEQLLDLAAIVRGEKENKFDTKYEKAVHRTILRACGIIK